MFSHQPLLPRALFLRRLFRNVLIMVAILILSLGIGVVGYHTTESLSWLDSLLNASMILGGMGPVDRVASDAGKIFASCYALFAGVALLATVGVMLGPVLHRVLHHFHLPTEEDEESESAKGD